jgi:hypothetical protein
MIGMPRLAFKFESIHPSICALKKIKPQTAFPCYAFPKKPCTKINLTKECEV